MPSRELTEILALIPPDFADPGADYVAVRAMLAPFHGHAVPAHVSVTEAEPGGVRCAWYEDARQPRRERVVFHCHGGGLVSCPLDDYHFYGALLAEQLEARVVMADYRLAPEHPFPAAHADCTAAYRGLLAGGVDPAHLVVSGDSCGGLLGLGALLDARDVGLAPAAAFVSISGWFDVAVPDPVERGSDPFLTAAWVRHRGREYASDRVALDDPRLSPAYADLAGLPPLYLPSGEYDTLRHGTEALARAAMEAGVAVTAESWPGMVHGWQGLVSAGVPEAAAAFARARAYLDDLGV
ncbi:MAG TPA: alpha/beta hydrolase fold domain-containing protein [Acidimicrobiales bacterium]|nr:alpha/beta hydrolase fold domain-containing protein [Acidimicrobiales bacterium]